MSIPTSLKAGMIAVGIIALPVTLLGGCEEQGPAEKAGEAIDESIQDTKRAVQDAQD